MVRLLFILKKRKSVFHSQVIAFAQKPRDYERLSIEERMEQELLNKLLPYVPASELAYIAYTVD